MLKKLEITVLGTKEEQLFRMALKNMHRIEEVPITEEEFRNRHRNIYNSMRGYYGNTVSWDHILEKLRLKGLEDGYRKN